MPRVLEITSFYGQTRCKEENITQNKAGIEKGMALFRLITIFFFLRERLLLGARLNFLKKFLSFIYLSFIFLLLLFILFSPEKKQIKDKLN